MSKRAELGANVPRIGLNREESAVAVGVSGTTFDKMVRDGRMPKMVGAKKLWSLEALRASFATLPEGDEDDGRWDDVSP